MKIKRKTFGTVQEANKHFTEHQPIDIVRLEPEQVIIPVNMAIGAPAIPVVAVGDSVKVGTLIAKADNIFSANHHSSISGTVVAIEERMTSKGMAPCIIIQNDYQNDTEDMAWTDSDGAFIENVRQAGIIGMGGAGFPTHIKLETDKKIDSIIINAAECEPYATCDNRVLIEHAEQVIEGAKMVAQKLGATKIYVGLETNEPAATKAVQSIQAHDPSIIIKTFGTRYPMGAEKTLIKVCLEKEVPLGKLPADVGCIVSNVNTFYAIYQAVNNHAPLTHRVVTIAGSPLKESKNLWVPIGTPIDYVINICGGFKEEPNQVIMGGPMMGTAIDDGQVPIVKNTTHITFRGVDEVPISNVQHPCIRCSECLNVCPVGLQPILISNAYERGNIDAAEKLGAMSCIECGNCTYICPSKIPLLDNIIAAKSEIMTKEAK